jgi:hypothetical protein
MCRADRLFEIIQILRRKMAVRAATLACPSSEDFRALIASSLNVLAARSGVSRIKS